MHVSGEIESLKEELREHGLHATSARVGVLQVLRQGHTHQTVEEIRSNLLARYPTIDPATVYRTLETLETHDLAVRVELRDKLTRWAHLTDAHHHLVCDRCGATVQLDDAPFQELAVVLSQRHGVRVDMRHQVVHGLCSTCAASISDLPAP